ncbi:MAG TPA: methylenetetrahydrofolate reductase [Acetobacteraceae bacterium]|jgi:methylenetetrahydrofolate reductase (NADPH)|nr:methylenetetrahydrofolate reductase [Acetobacteraceae bacterium]
MDAATSQAAQRSRAAELIGGCSIELSPRDEFAGEALRKLLDPGRTVFVNHAPSVTHHDIVAACVRLNRAGFVPVPHVAARRLASYTQASDFLHRAVTEAGVEAALIIGGDDSPAGPFRASLDLLATGVVERHGIKSVAFAGYPEGHPAIDSHTLDAALQAKVALARQRGLDVSLVTQFGFEADPILRWTASLRAQGIACPVRVGVAGPARVATLAKFAIRCGIGASLRALARGHTAFARILVEAGPDTLIGELVAGEDASVPIVGLHVFTFGGVRRTVEWIRATRDAA